MTMAERIAELTRQQELSEGRRREMERILTDPKTLHYDTKGVVISHRTSPSGFDKYAQVTTAGWVDLYTHYAAEDSEKFDIKHHMALSPSEFETLVATYCIQHPEMLGQIMDRVNAECERQEVLRDVVQCPVCTYSIIAGEQCSNCQQTFTTPDGQKLPGYVVARNAWRRTYPNGTYAGNRFCDNCGRAFPDTSDCAICPECRKGVVTGPADMQPRTDEPLFTYEGSYEKCVDCGEPATHLMAKRPGDVRWDEAVKLHVCSNHIRPYHKMEVL